MRRPVFAGSSCRANGGEDPAARRVELLVARTRCPQRELLDAVAREARVGMAVDEARDRAEPAAVELLDLVVEWGEVAHPADGLDPSVRAQHVGGLDHIDEPQLSATQGCAPTRGSGELLEVADQEPASAGRRIAHSPLRRAGSSRPCCSAASIASG